MKLKVGIFEIMEVSRISIEMVSRKRTTNDRKEQSYRITCKNGQNVLCICRIFTVFSSFIYFNIICSNLNNYVAIFLFYYCLMRNVSLTHVVVC